jgi:hypothetical protein
MIIKLREIMGTVPWYGRRLSGYSSLPNIVFIDVYLKS